MRLRLAAVVFAGAGFVLPAVAGEAEVRQAIDDLARLYAPAEGATLAFSFSGRARITSQNSVHQVVLPALEILYKGIRFQLGDLPLTLREQNDGRLAFQAAIPLTVLVRDPDYQELGQATLRAPKFSASFDPGLFAFTAVEFLTGPVEFRMTYDDASFKIGSIALTHAAGATTPRNWITQTSGKFSRVEYRRRDFAMSIAEVASNHRLVDIDLASYGAAAKANGIDPLVAWPQFGDSAGMSAGLGAVLGGTHIGSVVSDSRLTGVVSKGGGSFGFSVGAVGIAATLADFEATRANLRMGVKIDQLAIGAEIGPGVAPLLLPRAATVDLELKNLPIAALIAMAEQSPVLGIEPTDGPFEFFQKLTGETALNLRLHPSRIESQALTVALTGGFVTDAISALGGQGTLVFEISGLQGAIQRLRQQRDDPLAAQAAAFCLILQSIGKPIGPGTRADNPLSYELALNAAGETLLNGIDIGTLLGLLQPPAR